MDLTPEEIRVLGCLIEKSQTTPDHYPLSTNALVAACNQKSSRDPIVSFTEREVDQVSTDLREEGLVRVVRGAGMRTHKHKHILDEALNLSSHELAVLAVLMLRGPQSHGELRTRTERYVQFADNNAVLEILSALEARPERFVANIGREAGQAQDRWRHTMSTAIASESQASTSSAVSSEAVVQQRPASASSVGGGANLADRVAELERRLAALELSLGVDD